jgi:hypothetical protein
VVDVAHGSALDLVTHQLDIVTAPALERDREHLALFPGDPDDLLAFLNRAGEGLLD